MRQRVGMRNDRSSPRDVFLKVLKSGARHGTAPSEKIGGSPLSVHISKHFLVVSKRLVFLVVPDVPIVRKHDIPEIHDLLFLKSVLDVLDDVADHKRRRWSFLREQLGIEFREIIRRGFLDAFDEPIECFSL